MTMIFQPINPLILDFKSAIELITNDFIANSRKIKTDYWQARNIKEEHSGVMYERLFLSFTVKSSSDQSLEYYRHQIEPNLPWADTHFEERVCGYPINPGTEWSNWPFAHSAEKSLNDKGKFNHNYMERYWPTRASLNNPATRTKEEFKEKVLSKDKLPIAPNQGMINLKQIKSIMDLAMFIAKDPFTRQGYFPLYYPEDVAHNDRKPCTLGYHFLFRDNKLHIKYDMRSCDLYRHFKDDIYLTIRLALWVLEVCKKENPSVFSQASLGNFSMTISSLHCFINDYPLIKESLK